MIQNQEEGIERLRHTSEVQIFFLVVVLVGLEKSSCISDKGSGWYLLLAGAA